MRRFGFRWIIAWLVVGMIIWLGLVLGLGAEVLGPRGQFGMGIVAAMVAALTVIPAVFGARTASGIAGAGVLIGLGYLAYVRQTVAGWGDLVGMFAFLSVFVIAWVIGLVLQAIFTVLRKRNQTTQALNGK